MKAIQTKYIGPTNFRGSRVKAYTADQSITVPFDDEKGGIDGAHDKAAAALIKKMGWEGEWHRGGSTDKRGNVYVCVARTEDGKSYGQSTLLQVE